jgi:hypothetical protein
LIKSLGLKVGLAMHTLCFLLRKSQKACLLGRLKWCSTQRMVVVPFLTGQPGAARATHETDGASLAGPQKTQSSGLNSRQ